MQTVIDSIYEHVLIANRDASFLHGVSFEMAVDNQINDTTIAYVFLDPVVKTGSISNATETYAISLGFIKQDAPESSPQEEEVIVEAMDIMAMAFLNSIYDSSVGMVDNYTVSPIRKIRNVCTGVLLTFDLVTVRPC